MGLDSSPQGQDEGSSRWDVWNNSPMEFLHDFVVRALQNCLPRNCPKLDLWDQFTLWNSGSFPGSQNIVGFGGILGA